MLRIEPELTDSLKKLETAITGNPSTQTNVFKISELDLTSPINIAFILNGGLFQDGKTYLNVRKELVNQHKLKAIITLACGFLLRSMVSVSILVFGENTDGIYMVDASDVYTQLNRHERTLSDDNISEIVTACKSETSISRYVTHDQIVAENYQLCPSYYIDHRVNFESTVTLKDITKRVICGVEMNPHMLEDALSTEPTELYAMDIKDIGTDSVYKLPFIKYEQSYVNHVIPNNSLVMSKFGNTRIEIKNFHDAKVIAVGRMYVLELDTEKVNPYYIKAFLNSECGKYELDHCKLGATMQVLDLNLLMKLNIPMVDIDTQNLIAKTFCLQGK